MFAYLIYIDLPFHDRFMTFVIYILDVFIAQMGLRCNVVVNFDFILYVIKIISITIVKFLLK